jgi:hypothetical protein
VPPIRFGESENHNTMIAPGETTMGHQRGSAFITTKKGFCYLTIKSGGHNYHIMRIRAYTIDADDKRHMRRLYPDVVFDWKKVVGQLAEKREVCRVYRSRRRPADTIRPVHAREPLYGFFEPGTRTVYVSGLPSNITEAGKLLDVVLNTEQGIMDGPDSLPPSSENCRGSKPRLRLVK